jgi:hypothetical protein
MSYGIGLWDRNISNRPWSSEPNTPWLVADYLIQTSKYQDKADVWKKVNAEGQLDVFLCSDPNCNVLVDLRNITQKASQAGVLALSYARANNLWASGLGTLQQPMAASLHSRNDLLPQQFKITRPRPPPANLRRVETTPTIQAATWLEANVSMLGHTNEAPGPAREGLLRNDVGLVLPLATTTRLNLTHLNHTRVGLYQATLLQASSKGDFRRGDCVFVVWPENEWMHKHHWDLSLSEEMCQSCLLGSSEYSGCPLYLFDSYVLKVANGYSGHTLNLLEPAEKLPRSVFDDGCLCRNDTDVPVCPATATDAGACCRQRCSVLQVGDATIAAMPLLTGSSQTSSFTAEALATLHKMYVLATVYNASVMPWCGLSGLACDSHVFGSVGDPEVEEYTPANNTYTTMHQAALVYDVVCGPYFEGEWCLEALAGYHCADAAAVEEGLRSIVQDATRVVERVAAAELGSTDFTSNIFGAVGRISLTIVGVVAMAMGRKDMARWVRRLLKLCACGCCWAFCIHFLTFFWTCGLVWLGSALSSVVAAIGEDTARVNNPDGNTSRVGLVAADASFVGPNSPLQPYVVVGVLSIRVMSEHSPFARFLTFLNLVVANLIALIIMICVGWDEYVAWHAGRNRAALHTIALNTQPVAGPGGGAGGGGAGGGAGGGGAGGGAAGGGAGGGAAGGGAGGGAPPGGGAGGILAQLGCQVM